LVRETPAGREVKVSISRGGAIQNLTIRTGVRKLAVAKVGEPMRIEIPNFEIPDFNIPDVPRSTITWRSAALGVEAESLSGQLADYFGVKEGVLVRSVAKDTAADKAGIKAGDVITRVDGTPVTNPAEVTNALKLARGRSVGLQIVRERRELSLSITVGE
jgi:serine protease Do